MSDYTLNIAFTEDQVQALRQTGKNVIIAKSVKESQYKVAWQVFAPDTENTVEWNEAYGIYAAKAVTISNGAVIKPLFTVPDPANLDDLYILEQDGTFSSKDKGGKIGAYTIENNYTSPVIVGLYEAAEVNGVLNLDNIVSVKGAAMSDTVIQTPTTIINIWVQDKIQSNSVVISPQIKKTQITYDDGINTISVHYDSDNNTFILDDN